jgi:hypothetical protein
MRIPQIIILPLTEFWDFKYQVGSLAHRFEKDAAIAALEREGSLQSRALAFGLTIYQRGKPRFAERLHSALKKDQSDYGRLILSLLSEIQMRPKRRKKKKKKKKRTVSNVHSASTNTAS